MMCIHRAEQTGLISSAQVSVCLTNSLYLFLSAGIPSSPMILPLFLSLLRCPSISHLLWISQQPSLRGPSKKLHIITLRFDTDVLEHLSHLSGCIINIWSRPLSLGVGGAASKTHIRVHNTGCQTSRCICQLYDTLYHSRTHGHVLPMPQIFSSSWVSLPTGLAWLPWAQ